MDPFLAHCLILAWLGYGAARRMVADLAGQILVTALLAWGNLVATCLLLGAMSRLGEPVWFFCISTALALLGLVSLRSTGYEIAPDPSVTHPDPAEPQFNPWLLVATILMTAPLAALSLAAACLYEPAGAAALSHVLPRALYYLGQGSLSHFDATDVRQVALPFNSSLLYLLGLVYRAPLQCLAILNLLAWLASGAAVYRLCRLCRVGRNLALTTCGLLLVATPVLAAASSVTVELPETAALVGAAGFALQAAQTGRRRHALLAGLALGLAGGSDLRSLCLMIAAGASALAWGAWRGINRLRPCLLPALLSATLALPFAAINGIERGPGLRQLLQSDAPARTPAIGILFKPLIRQPAPPGVLSEDNIGWGLVGVLLLVAMILGLARLRGPAAWAAWLAAAWVLADLALPSHTGPATGAFIPAALLLGPALAVILGPDRATPPMHRRAGYAVAGLAAALAGWSAMIYLGTNASHPLASWLAAPSVLPKPAPLPLLLDYHVAKAPRINVETDGAHEQIFRIMARARQAVFASRQILDPAAYNLISRSSRSRESGYADLGELPSYTLVPVEAKRTAGVEFLATLGTGTAARDYFGVEPGADGRASLDGNQALLVTLSREPSSSPEATGTRIKLEGLNPNDHAKLEVALKLADDRFVPVTTLTASGETSVPITRPFSWLVFRAVDVSSGRELGSAVIPYRARVGQETTPIDLEQPSGPKSIYLTDAVRSKVPLLAVGDGLLPTEGPFPQWNLPFIRWAKKPSVRLEIPATPGLVRLQLRFSVRLHVREQANLDVLLNDQPVRHYRISNRTAWLDDTLELTARPGANVIEFRDATFRSKPDWSDYLKRYPDVKDYLVSQHLPLEAGAEQHYEQHGRSERRTVQMRVTDEMEPVPGSFYFMFRSIRVEGFKSQ